MSKGTENLIMTITRIIVIIHHIQRKQLKMSYRL